MPPIPDAVAFFRLSAGCWRSQRTSHHLLHRRAETGGSLIAVAMLSPEDARLAEIARLHGEPPERVAGGCHVRWDAAMAWDRAGEDHQGETVFALVPTDQAGREGKLLRDRGYAETAAVAGEFRMDHEDALELVTSYETMSSHERFWFLGADVRLRASTVEGLSNSASLCIETRLDADFKPLNPSAAPAAGPPPLPAGPEWAAFGW